VPLTKRQLEVVRCIANGMTNNEIAKKLFITPNSVRTHIKYSLVKLGMKGRGGLAVYYVLHSITEERRRVWRDSLMAHEFIAAVCTLTEHELTILDMLAGRPDITNDQIAAVLVTDIDDVKDTLRRIGDKCGIQGPSLRTLLAVRRVLTKSVQE